LRQLERELGDVRVVRSGSVGIKCSLVARGRADLYVHPVPFLKEWDTCAPEAILRGAGGRVTDCAGQPLAYGKPDPPQSGGIFAACADVWMSVAPIVGRVAAPLFADGGVAGEANGAVNH
jgi:3'(2'), 5'-bisphosphate nucleotidase